MRKTLWAAAAATALISTAAWATVTFNAGTGTGFVGNGDVQSAFGWNSSVLQAQAKAGNVSFAYDATNTYDVTCEFDTGVINITHHIINTTKHYTVNSSVAYLNRTGGNNQVTGFNLLSLSAGDGDTPPAVGDPCPGDSGLGTVTAAALTSSTGALSVSDVPLSLGPVVIYNN